MNTKSYKELSMLDHEAVDYTFDIYYSRIEMVKLEDWYVSTEGQHHIQTDEY